MKYAVVQKVTVTDMNQEMIEEVHFQHGILDAPSIHVGCTVITHPLGLKEFEVVYDQRYDEKQKSKVADIEFSMIDPIGATIYLEPARLIIGQHDIGKA